LIIAGLKDVEFHLIVATTSPHIAFFSLRRSTLVIVVVCLVKRNMGVLRIELLNVKQDAE
jgi:hypothetical protein